MRRQLQEWLKKKKNLSYFVILFFVLSVGTVFLSFLWAADNVSKYFSFPQETISNASQTGKNMGQFIRETIGSSSAINQKLFQPLTTPTPMYPLNGNESQAFKAQISCPGAQEFLKVKISQIGPGGDLVIDISYDSGLTGYLNGGLSVGGVSVICSNGFMICNPGTIDNCVSYIFYLDLGTLRFKKLDVSTTGQGLSGCFCVNNACRGQDGRSVLDTKLDYILKTIGSMVVSAFLNDPSKSSYVVSDSKIDINNKSITFYGQDSSQCKFADQGSNDVQNLKNYYQSPGILSTTGNYRLGIEIKNPNSTASLIYGAAQLSTGDVKICEKTKEVVDCSGTIVEKTKGDCNILSSCKIVEESWDGISIIKGGIKTGLNPVGNFIKDKCGNVYTFDWRTKRIVYVCPKENVSDFSRRVEVISNSTVWDIDTGKVYYNDTIIPNDCKASCPSGYKYNDASKQCEADPICPSGAVYDNRKNACVATPSCSSGGKLQIIDGELKCVIDTSCSIGEKNGTQCIYKINCPEGGSLQNTSEGLKCIYKINCPSGGKERNINGVVKCVSPIDCPINAIIQEASDRIKCVSKIDCPNGGSVRQNTTNGALKCVVKENLKCPNEGQIREVNKNGQSKWECVIDVNCPDNGNMTYTNGQWKCSLPVSCSYGSLQYTNGTNGTNEGFQCVYKISCPYEGSLQNGSNGGFQCVTQANVQCPPGFNYNATRGVCVASPSDWKLSCNRGGSFWWICSAYVRTVCKLSDGTVVYPLSTENPTWFSPADINQCTYNTCRSYLYPGYPYCNQGVTDPSYQIYNITRYVCRLVSNNMVYLYYPAKTTPICSQGTYNATTGMCETTPTFNCPPGYTPSFTSNSTVCVMNVSCPSGYTPDFASQACVKNIPCPPGLTPDPSSKTCVMDISCPPGYNYDSSLQACVMDPCPFRYSYDPTLQACAMDISCPSGYDYDSSSQTCVKHILCPFGYYYDPNIQACAMNVSCPSGYSYDNDLPVCSVNVSCPLEFNYNSTLQACVKGVYCPFGYVNQSGVCIANVICPSGTSPKVDNSTLDINSESSDNCNCPPEYTFDNSNSTNKICVAELYCPEGGTLVYDKNNLNLRCETELRGILGCGQSDLQYDPGSNVCYVPASCPLGSFNATVGQCTVAFNCPSNSTYDSTPTAKVCKTKVICPNGTRYNNWTKKCEGNPFCPQGVFDSSIGRCIICQQGSYYDNSTKKCKFSNGMTANMTFQFPCPDNMTLQSSLCVGDPLCPSGFSFDGKLDACVVDPECPSGFSFDASYDICIAAPNCPRGFQHDARGRCITNSLAYCPPGYAYDGHLQKCIMAIFCPSGGAWDESLGKCVQQSICGITSFSNFLGGYCEADPQCLNDGRLNDYGKCVLDTPCSNTTWKDVSQQSFDLKKGEESSDCEYVCKIQVLEPKTSVYMKNTPTSDVQYGTTTEKTGISIGESYYYKPCVEVATGQWECPLDEGEVMVPHDNGTIGCQCLGNDTFVRAAVVIQAIRQAGQDFICSSGKKYPPNTYIIRPDQPVLPTKPNLPIPVEQNGS